VQAALGQFRPAGPVVVAGVQVHRGLLRDGADLREQAGEHGEGGRQQQVIAGVGGRRQRRDRHPGAVGQLGAFQPLLGAVHRAAPGTVAAAEDQRLDELVEDDPVVDAPTVTAQRMPVHPRWPQGEELLAQRVKDARWNGRHERSTAHGASAPSRA